MKPPAPISNLDYALLLVSFVAWALAMIAVEAGEMRTAWATITVGYGFFAIYFVREMRRLVWGFW